MRTPGGACRLVERFDLLPAGRVQKGIVESPQPGLVLDEIAQRANEPALQDLSLVVEPVVIDGR